MQEEVNEKHSSPCVAEVIILFQ